MIFNPLKNTLLLVRAFGVIGGGAALAFLGATAGQALIQAGVLGGLGIAGKWTINDIDNFLILL